MSELHPAPPDASAREWIVDELDRTLFVEAGAGSGKTTSLVARLVALILDGAEVESIAAITFTEAAAAELRARVRQSLEDVVAGRPVRGVQVAQHGADRAREALDRLDRASISTLHAFAQRLLTSAPVEAGLPPRIEVLDEITTALRTDERWAGFVSRLLEDPQLEVALRAALALGIETRHLAAVAASLNANWDLLVDLDLDADRSSLLDEESITLSIQPLLDAADQLGALAETCADPDDLLCRWIVEDLPPALAPLRAATSDPFSLLQATGELPKCTTHGRASNWPDDGKRTARAIWTAATEELSQERARISDRVLRRLTVEVVEYTLAEAEARRRAGTLEFHDLLVLARQLVRDDPDVRRRLHDRFRHLLIDEFQDTDPIQIELAVRIAADPDHDPSRPWHEVEVEEGRLFFVGDPKQSIYRFRRADIDLFVRTAERHASGATRLDTNFRTVAPIVDFTNDLFGVLITRTESEPGLDGRAEVAQPDYAELQAFRGAMADDPGPAVLLVGRGETDATADSLRAAEASDIAAALARAEREAWLVQPDGESARPCRWGDMAVLLPSRTSLPHLRRALAEAGVPYRLETGSLVYATTEVRDLLSVLRSIDDPGDQISLLGALRSPAYGCGDDDLLAWVRAGRSWSYLGHDRDADSSTGSDTGSGAVADALRDLRARHRSRPFTTVPEMVERVIRDRRLLETSLAGADHRDTWRLYRVVVEHARQFADSDSSGLRGFLRWAALQADDKRRTSVPMLPEADVDAVRIMTIHGAKGLEFGITAVSGLSGVFPNTALGATVRFRPEGGYDVRMRRGLETAQFEARRTVEDLMGQHEGIRLLYVALTRARDHLVVSLHHKASKNSGVVRSHAQRIARALDDLDVEAMAPAVETSSGTSSQRAHHGDDGPRPVVAPTPVGSGLTGAMVDDWVESQRVWERRRERLLASSVGGGAVSATALARHLLGTTADGTERHGQPRTRDQPEPEGEPWRRGRAGTSVGRAVHAVLQHADLADPTGLGLASLAAWQAQVEGMPHAAGEIEVKARAAVRSDLVRRAVVGRWWREVHVGVPVAAILRPSGDPGADGSPVDLFEGFVDLLFEDEDGRLVVVDYKTDAVPDEATLRAALERYTPQGAAYAVALEAATGRPVGEVHFLFLRGHEAIGLRVTDLDEQAGRIRDALRTYGVESWIRPQDDPNRSVL